MGRAIALLAGVLALTACARLERYVQEASAELHQTFAKPLHYRLAGADAASRKSFDEGLERLRAGDHRAAVTAFNRALWDVERLERRALRLEELSDLHVALAKAYTGLGRPQWAEEHRWIAERAREAVGRDPLGTWPQGMERARTAYLEARFPEALTAWRDTLVDLEDVADSRSRIRRVEAVRCYLALTHWALGDEDRVRDELRRLAALDASMAICEREAPPSMRILITEVQKTRQGLN
jgi:hypothetical protein